MATNTAASFTNHTGNNTAGPFPISFSYLDEDEIDVTVDGDLKNKTTHYTFPSATTISFTSGNHPSNGAVIKFQRDTDISTKKVDFQDGSVLTEADLDNINNQTLYALQENLDTLTTDYLRRDGTQTVTGNIVFEGATDNAHETSLTVTDPTADRTITFPDISGTVITTADTGTVTSTIIANGTIVNTDINSSAEIAVSKLADGSARQLLQTAANGNDVEWTSNVDIPGTLDVTGLTHFDNHVSLNDNIKINLGSSGSSDSSISYNGAGTGALEITTAGKLDVSAVGSQNFKIGSAIRLALIDSSVDAADGIYCNWPVVPGTNNQYDLGTDALEWKDIYIDGVAYLDEISLDDDQKIKLGDATDDDAEIYYSGNTLHIDSDKGIILETGTGSFSVSNNGTAKFGYTFLGGFCEGDFFPLTTNDHDLGTSNFQWKDLYIDGTAYLDTADISSFTGSAVITTGTSTSDTEVYSAKHTEALFLRQDSTETLASGVAWSSNDTTVATTGAIDARVRGLVTDVGGFRPIASEAVFPTTNPDPDDNAGTIVSITALSADRTASGTTLTAGCQTTGGTQVTITGCPNNQVFKQGYGLLVETTSTLNTYTFVRYVADTSSVATVAGINSNVTTVAGISANVTTVAGNSTNINTVAGISSNVTTVANDGTDIGTVAGSISNINTAAGAIANINTTAAAIANVNTVAGINANVTTVAGISANVTTVANDGTDIGTVAGSISNINTTAGSISNVNTAAGSISNVNTVAGSISNVNTVGSNITNVTNASTYLNNFLSLYLGQASSDPTVDGLGNALTEGDKYFNTVSKQMRVWNGQVWQGITENAIEVSQYANSTLSSVYTASAGSNSIDLGGLAVTGTAFSSENIAGNRMSLAKGSGTFNLGGI